MGVDSGLPDFRGAAGFWKAYPPYKDLGFEFMDVASPDRFLTNPALGWGFYGHRLNLYRKTIPHAGFTKLLEFSSSLKGGCFVYTSNVDGHFQRSGFTEEQIIECHGSIHHQQCAQDCRGKIWPTPEGEIVIEESTMLAQDPLPQCPDCDEVARPNILMFGDWHWNSRRALGQQARFRTWLESVYRMKVLVLEIGAGMTIQTVRINSEEVARVLPHASLIRVNPLDSFIPNEIERRVSLKTGGLDAIRQLLD